MPQEAVIYRGSTLIYTLFFSQDASAALTQPIRKLLQLPAPGRTFEHYRQGPLSSAAA